LENSGQHILDNAVWNAFTTGNRSLSHGDDAVRYLDKQVSPFVGLNTYDEANFAKLWNFIEDGRVVVLPARRDFVVPQPWKILHAVPVEQMVYAGSTVDVAPNDEIVSLGEQDVPQMVFLTKLTDPGPFDVRTIEYGHYEGIYRDGRLVAMAGQRMHPVPYAEISAVCTHPDYAGHGFASQLMKRQINRMLDAGDTPFLHVKTENERAIRLYEHLGFVNRASITVFVMQKA
jgi:ribosomal protein S18 acetylase RimI-like enzyme